MGERYCSFFQILFLDAFRISAIINLQKFLANLSLQFYLRSFLQTHLCLNELASVLIDPRPVFPIGPICAGLGPRAYGGLALAECATLKKKEGGKMEKKK